MFAIGWHGQPMGIDIRTSITVLAAASLVGCASPARPHIPSGTEHISFRPQPGPFCGRCETKELTVAPDGWVAITTGHWAGNYRNWTQRRTVRTITPEQFEEFRHRLDVLTRLPEGQGNHRCTEHATDLGGIIVEWVKGTERRVRTVDFGCLDDRELIDAVLAAPEALGL
jgi:hypothetical protein